MGEIKIPVTDPDAPLNHKAISDLPRYLDDPEDAAVTRQLLQIAHLAALPSTVTVGAVVDMLESCDHKSLQFFREGAEKLAGLAEARREREREQTERTNRVRMASQPSRLTLTPDGWKDLAGEASEALRVEAELRSRRAQLEAEQEQRAIEAQRSDAYKRAREAHRARELPAHLR